MKGYLFTTAVAILFSAVVVGLAWTHETTDRTGQWQLRICSGISSFGCGSVTTRHFEDQQSCLAVADTIVVDRAVSHESGNRRDAIVTCLPAE